MNDAVAKCPHCGEKQVRSAPAAYTRAEIQALIDNEEAYAAHTGTSAIFKSLLSPHKHTKGVMRLLELVLTGVTLPAVVIGAFGIALLGARRSKGAFSTSGEIAPVVVMTILGGGTIAMWAGGSYAMVAISAMWARAAIRMISAGQREREMIELDQKDAAKRALASGPAPALPSSSTPKPAQPVAALPPARVVSEQARPSTPALRTPEPPKPVVAVERPKTGEPDKAIEPGDEPSFLR
ncbi:MAG TPA: hypothetical protein VL326_34680 [Kofleriaceae bacterium]|nr:hypothetical protein [Kofleriaceae bacterium]